MLSPLKACPWRARNAAEDRADFGVRARRMRSLRPHIHHARKQRLFLSLTRILPLFPILYMLARKRARALPRRGATRSQGDLAACGSESSQYATAIAQVAHRRQLHHHKSCRWRWLRCGRPVVARSIAAPHSTRRRPRAAGYVLRDSAADRDFYQSNAGRCLIRSWIRL